MKSILLASASAFAFAGAAAAEITYGGDASLEYNSNDGFSYGIGLDVNASQELDNGLTVAGTFSFGLGNYYCYDGNSSSTPLGSYGYSVCFTGYELSLTSDTAGLYFGDTDSSADKHWVGVDGMEADGFYETGDLGEAEDDVAGAVLRGEVTFGSVTGSLSYAMGDDGDRGGLTSGDLHSMQVAVVADLGGVTAILAYQETTVLGGYDEIFALSAQTNLAGADLTVAAARNSTSGEESFGLGVAYPVGPVTLGATYASNSIADDAWEVTAEYADGPITVSAAFDSTDDYSLEGTYDVGNGLVVYAGFTDAGNDYYVGGAYDLGSGAEFFAVYAEDGNSSGDDEFGPNEVDPGTTVGLSFEF